MLDSSSTTLNKPEYGRKLLCYVENFQVLIERKFWREKVSRSKNGEKVINLSNSVMIRVYICSTNHSLITLKPNVNEMNELGSVLAN